MKVKALSFGSTNIDSSKDYVKDVVIRRGKIKKRKKESKIFRSQFGHTPISILENIPWDCKKLIIGIGHSTALPVMQEVKEEAKKKGIEIVLMRTPDAIHTLMKKIPILCFILPASSFQFLP